MIIMSQEAHDITIAKPIRDLSNRRNSIKWANHELLPTSSVAVAGLDEVTLHIQVAPVESPEVDRITQTHSRIRRCCIKHCFQWVVTAELIIALREIWKLQ
jgi:hypothetical protein